MERSLAGLLISVMVVDGTVFKGQNLVVAVGIDASGHKLVLGLRQGATENAAVVGGLLGDLMERGLDFTTPRLYLVDGGKGIRAAMRNFAGDAAFVQRCQEHKIRNVAGHVPESDRAALRYRMRAAYNALEAADSRNLLYKLHDELVQSNPSAAASLQEGLEECLTIAELRLPGKLRQTFHTTNCIESGFSIVETICQQVKRWQGSDHRQRWIASALLFAESRWNRIHGYRHMPVLINALKVAFTQRCAQNAAASKKDFGAA